MPKYRHGQLVLECAQTYGNVKSLPTSVNKAAEQTFCSQTAESSMATGSRTLWKGAITFGLVHIPVGLHTAATVKVHAFLCSRCVEANRDVNQSERDGTLPWLLAAAPSGRVPSRSDWFTSLLASTQRLQRKAWTLTGWTSAAWTR